MKKKLSMGRGEHDFKKEMRISHYPLCYAKISHSCEIQIESMVLQICLKNEFAYGWHMVCIPVKFA